MTEENIVVDKTEVDAVEKTGGIVTVASGETLNFGKNGKVLAAYDVEKGTLVFNTVAGATVTCNLLELPVALRGESLVEPTVYGIREYIKASLAPVKPSKLADAIIAKWNSLLEGKFETRSVTGSDAGLDDFLTAFAYIHATGTIMTVDGIAMKVPASALYAELHPSWKDTKDSATIEEVTTLWDSFDAKLKNIIKRNDAWVKMQVAQIKEGVQL